MGKILDIVAATAAVREAAEAASEEEVPIVLTARAENYLYGVNDLDDTIARLVAYREAGAEVLYAPGISDLEPDRDARRRGRRTGERPRQCPGGPTLSELEELGVRRVSTGAGPAKVAYGAALHSVRHLLSEGTVYTELGFSAADRDGALDAG